MRKVEILMTSAVADAEGKFWFFDRRSHSVGYFTSDNLQIHIVSVYPKPFHALNVYLIDSFLLFSSQTTPDILMYDMKRNHFELFQCEEERADTQYISILWNEQIFFFPVKMEFMTHIFKFQNRKFESLMWLRSSDQGESMDYPYQQEGELWIPLLNKNEIYILNLQSHQYEKMILDRSIHLRTITKKDDDLWMIQSDKKTIVRYCAGNYEKIVWENEEVVCKDSFSRILCIHQKIVVLPRFNATIFIYDVESKKKQEIPIPIDGDEGMAGRSLLFGYVINANQIIFLPWGKREFIIIDLDTYELREVELGVDVCSFYRLTSPKFIYESTEDDLQEFCAEIGKIDASAQNTSITIGRAIYQHLTEKNSN